MSGTRRGRVMRSVAVSSALVLIMGVRARGQSATSSGRKWVVSDSLTDVQALIDGAAPHDTIEFAAGTFAVRRESGFVIQNKRDLTILGQGRRTLIKMRADVDYAFQMRDNVHGLTLARLAIEGTVPTVPIGRKPSAVATQDGVHVSSVSVTDLDIGNVAVGIRVGGGVAGVYDSVLVARNSLHDIIGTVAGSGYGIHNDNARNVVIADNVIRGVQRHSIYQARGDSHIVIQGNLIVDHGRDHPITTNVALVIARSAHVTAANNTILNSYNRAMSVEPDDRPELNWPVHHIYLIGNRLMGYRDIGIWLAQNPMGHEIMGWGNALVPERENRRPDVADGRDHRVVLPEPPYWRGTRAVAPEGGFLYVMRGDTLYQTSPKYGTLPDSTWLVSRSPTRWFNFQFLTGGGDGYVYVLQNDVLHRIRPGAWDYTRSAERWKRVVGLLGMQGRLYVLAGDRPTLYRVNPNDWTRRASASDWSGTAGLAAWGGDLYLARREGTEEIRADSLILGPPNQP